MLKCVKVENISKYFFFFLFFSENVTKFYVYFASLGDLFLGAGWERRKDEYDIIPLSIC